tara:strand:- start:5566 stop:6690 length:1125 start_codon:yes stop_codon:yes gene_type:complete
MIRLLLLLLSLLLYSCSSTSTEYRSAKTYVGQRDYDRAEQIALQGIQNNPNDALTAYYLAAIIYGGQNSPKKDYAKAGEYFNLAIEIDNKDNEDQLLPEPIPVFNKNNEKVVLLTVKDAVYHDRYIVWGELYNQSVAFIDKQQNQKAIEPLQLASLVDPKNSVTYSVLCKLFFEQGREYFAKAIQNADIALSIDNSLTDLLTIKAEISKSNNDFIKAEEYLKQAYETAITNKEEPKKLTFHMANLFDILFTNGKKSEALDLSEKLIESDPENVLLYSNAGALYQNILIDEQTKASKSLARIHSLNEQELEDLKLIYQNCLELAQKARENFLMCNQLELDEEESELFYEEAKKIKIIKNDLKSYIRKIDKKIDEL